MPDWPALVRERLGTLGLGPEADAEIAAELADHLEDLYLEACARGITEQGAYRKALDEVGSWPKLAREIYGMKRGEDPMNERVRSLWLPGMVTLGVSMLILMIQTRIGPFPQIIWLRPGMPLMFYVPWLVALPVIGAAGAYWSRRTGGRLPTRLLAGVFPVLAMATTFFFSLLVGLIVNQVVAQRVPLSIVIPSFLTYLLGWVVIPGAALLLGALQFLRKNTRESLPSRA